MKARTTVAVIAVVLLVVGVVAWRFPRPAPHAPIVIAGGDQAAAPPAVGPEKPPPDEPPEDELRRVALNSTMKGECGVVFELWNRSGYAAWVAGPTRIEPVPPWIPTGPTEAETLTTATLVEVVGNQNAWRAQRRSAVRALGKRPNHIDTIAPVLVEAILNEDAAIRKDAAESLRALKYDESSGSDKLDSALKGETVEIRYWFAYQARQAKSALQGVEGGLLVPNVDIRIKAVELLGRLGDEAKPSVPLLRRLRDTCDDADLRRAAVLALSRLDGEDPIPELAKALKDPDPVARGRAAQQLARMGKAAVPALRAALKEDDAGVRASTLGVLGRIGGDARDAVPDLKPLLKHEDPLIRKLAADALKRIEPGERP